MKREKLSLFPLLYQHLFREFRGTTQCNDRHQITTRYQYNARIIVSDTHRIRQSNEQLKSSYMVIASLFQYSIPSIRKISRFLRVSSDRLFKFKIHPKISSLPRSVNLSVATHTSYNGICSFHYIYPHFHSGDLSQNSLLFYISCIAFFSISCSVTMNVLIPVL